MKFVGDKTQVYQTELGKAGKFPALTVADFQRAFHFLSNESEAAMLQQLNMARITVHRELKATLAPYDSLNALSLDKFDDESSGNTLYTQAVFSLAAGFIIGNQISTDTTAEAAERQDALAQKHAHCAVQYRRAIDLLTNAHETYCFEVV